VSEVIDVNNRKHEKLKSSLKISLKRPKA